VRFVSVALPLAAGDQAKDDAAVAAGTTGEEEFDDGNKNDG
jgi:hypothetical protein